LGGGGAELFNFTERTAEQEKRGGVK